MTRLIAKYKKWIVFDNTKSDAFVDDEKFSSDDINCKSVIYKDVLF